MVLSGSERHFHSVCGRIRMSQKCCILDVLCARHRENIAVAADLSHAQLQHQCGKASSQGEYSESNTHVLCSLPARLAKIACGCSTSSFGHGSQCRTISKVKNTNMAHSLGE